MTRRLRAVLGATILAVLVAMPTSASAAPRFTFEVIAGFPCVSGRGPASEDHVISLRTPDGVLRARALDRSDREGRWHTCFAFSGTTSINGGDIVKVRAAGQSRTVVVPDLAPRIDRVGDIVQGAAPAGSVVALRIVHQSSLRDTTDLEVDVTADADGSYAVDLTTEVDIIGGDGVLAIVPVGDDLFGAVGVAPFVEVGYANNTIFGFMNNGTDLRLVLRDDDASVKARAAAGPIIFGYFATSLFDADGHAVYPLAGDRLTASFASDARLLIPRTVLRADASEDTVSGSCMPGSRYRVSVDFRPLYGRTGPDGTFHRDLSGSQDVHVGDDLSLTCLYPSGDRLTRQSSALR